MPYVFLTILLIRGIMLPGAIDGIKYYLYPNWARLGDFQVWSDAGTQIFYSYGIGIAALVSLGSFNKFHHNSYRDVVVFTVINTLTSILAGFVIFSILGYMAYERGIDIKDVAEEGPGLAFIVYPQALQLLPWSPVWSFIFFVMLFLLGLGTQVYILRLI
jgi:solute carrier family 6 (neurotransmitter transporter, creatine) member 8